MIAQSDTFGNGARAAALALAALSTFAPPAEAIGSCEVSQYCLFSAPLPKAVWTNTPAETPSGRPCERTDAFVRSAGPDHAAACAGVRKAVEALGKCGIRPATTLFVDVADVVRGPDGSPMFSRFDRDDDMIVVAGSASIGRLAEDTPFARLPARDVFESLVAHETVHAVMDHGRATPTRTRAALEYSAFALQIDALPEPAREAFLLRVGAADGGAGSVFSDAMLQLDPYGFAARAYRHFKSESGGCKSLQAIASGRTAFIAGQ